MNVPLVVIGALLVIVGVILPLFPLPGPNWLRIVLGGLALIFGVALLLNGVGPLLPVPWPILLGIIGGLIVIQVIIALVPPPNRQAWLVVVGGKLVIIGGLGAALAYLCLPFYTRGTVTLTAGQIALLLTRIAGIAAYSSPNYGYGCGFSCGYATVHEMSQSWQQWWWLWWVVPALGALSAALGVIVDALGLAMLRANVHGGKAVVPSEGHRLAAAGAIEAGIVGLVVLVYLGLLVYLPDLLSAPNVCVLCDASQVFRALLHTAQSGFWVTGAGLLIVVVGGVLARGGMEGMERRATVSFRKTLNSTTSYVNLDTGRVSANTRVAHIRFQPSPAGPPQFDFVPVGTAQLASLSGRDYDQITRAELERLPYGVPSVPVEAGVAFAVRLPNRHYAKARVNTDPPNPRIEWITYVP